MRRGEERVCFENREHFGGRFGKRFGEGFGFRGGFWGLFLEVVLGSLGGFSFWGEKVVDVLCDIFVF